MREHVDVQDDWLINEKTVQLKECVWYTDFERKDLAESVN